MAEPTIEPMIDLLAEVWDELIELGSGLDEEQWKTPTELPGWSVQDNLAHIIGIERSMQGVPTPEDEPARTDHLRNAIGVMNEHWVEHFRPRSGAEVLDEFRALAAERLAELAALPPEAFDEVGPTPVGQAPFRVFLAVRVMDSWVHEQDIRRALGQPGHRHGRAVDLSVGRLIDGLPYVVGKQVGAPDGTTLVVTVSTPTADGDPEARVVGVVVEGRASLSDEIPDRPDASLAMDLDAFVALTTGRWDPDQALDDGRVAVTGDAELGHQVVRHLNFMI